MSFAGSFITGRACTAYQAGEEANSSVSRYSSAVGELLASSRSMVNCIVSLPFRSMRMLSVTSIRLGNTASACCSPSLKNSLSATIRTPRRSITVGRAKLQATSVDAPAARVKGITASSILISEINSSVRGLKSCIVTSPISRLSERLEILLLMVA